MNYVKEVIIATYVPYGESPNGIPFVDVEFHRRNNDFKCYENLTSRQLARVCNALEAIRPNSTSAETKLGSVTVHFYI